MELIKQWKAKRAIARWKKNGCPAPPPHLLKQGVLKEFAEKYQLKTMVETGTFKGDMVAAMRPHFEEIYSIELATHLYENAVKRFKHDNGVHLLQGDSGQVFSELVPKLTKPTLYWLDGHYSGGQTAQGDLDTPIIQELDHIFSSGKESSIILIDDARCFGDPEHPDYPSVSELEKHVLQNWPNASVTVELDSIRIIPSSLR